MLKSLKKSAIKYNKFLRFLIVGVSNLLAFFIFYYILEFVWDNYQLSNIVAFIISSLNGYFWNKNWVFNNKKGSTFVIIKFYIVYMITWLLSALLLYFWIEILKISKNIAPIINLFITTPINYLLNKLWVFKNR